MQFVVLGIIFDPLIILYFRLFHFLGKTSQDEMTKLKRQAKNPHYNHPSIGYVNPFNLTCFQDAQGLEGAGVMLVRKNAQKEPIIYIGQRKKSKWVFPAGHCEKEHRNAIEAAVTEAFEETGGVCSLNPDVLAKAPSIYSKKMQRKLFVVYVNDTISRSTLNTGLEKAKHNAKLPQSFKEIKEYRAVPVSHFIQSLELSRAGKNVDNLVKDRRGNGLPMNSQFYQAAVDCCDEVKAIMVGLFGSKVLSSDFSE